MIADLTLLRGHLPVVVTAHSVHGRRTLRESQRVALIPASLEASAQKDAGSKPPA